MKAERLFRAIGLVDEGLIEAAANLLFLYCRGRPVHRMAGLSGSNRRDRAGRSGLDAGGSRAL